MMHRENADEVNAKALSSTANTVVFFSSDVDQRVFSETKTNPTVIF